MASETVIQQKFEEFMKALSDTSLPVDRFIELCNQYAGQLEDSAAAAEDNISDEDE